MPIRATGAGDPALLFQTSGNFVKLDTAAQTLEQTHHTSWRTPAVAAGGALLLFLVVFWRLGAVSFWDPDEAHYAETTREMIASGDWLAPYYNQVPFFDKPIYFHWLQGISMLALGATETAARLASAAGATALVIVTGWIGWQLAGASVGWIAALLLAANPGTFGLARYAILDAPFTACLFGGAGLVIVSATRHQPRLELAGYLLLAIATCIKGPVAIALAGLAFIIASIVSREARRLLLGLHWMRGACLVVILGSLWPLYMWWRFEQLFVQGYFLNENIRLFSESLYANQPGWWFYIGILIAGFLPWTGVLVGRMSDAVRSAIGRRPPVDVVDVLLWSWTAAVVGFFSFSQFKLDHYVFPAAPALCLLCARAWTDARSTQGEPGSLIGVRTIGPLIALAGLAVGYLAVARLDLPATFLVVPAALVVVGLVAAARYWAADRRSEIPALGFVALAIVYAGVLIWVLPSLETGKVVPDVARWVAAHATPADRVVTFQLSRWNPTFRFYVDRPVTMLDADEEARRFFADPRPYYCVMTASRLATLEFLGVPMEVVYKRDGLWASSGQALWRRKGEPTTFVVTRPRVP